MLKLIPLLLLPILTSCVTMTEPKISDLEHRIEMLEIKVKLLELGFDEIYTEGCSL